MSTTNGPFDEFDINDFIDEDDLYDDIDVEEDDDEDDDDYEEDDDEDSDLAESDPKHQVQQKLVNELLEENKKLKEALKDIIPRLTDMQEKVLYYQNAYEDISVKWEFYAGRYDTAVKGLEQKKKEYNTALAQLKDIIKQAKKELKVK